MKRSCFSEGVQEETIKEEYNEEEEIKKLHLN